MCLFEPVYLISSLQQALVDISPVNLQLSSFDGKYVLTRLFERTTVQFK